MKQEIKMDKEIFGIVGDEALKNRAARFDGTLRKYSGVSSGVEEEKLVLSFLQDIRQDTNYGLIRSGTFGFQKTKRDVIDKYLKKKKRSDEKNSNKMTNTTNYRFIRNRIEMQKNTGKLIREKSTPRC